MNTIKLELTKYGKGWKEGFAAGRAYQSELDKDAVAWGTAGIVAALDKAAALEAAKEEA